MKKERLTRRPSFSMAFDLFLDASQLTLDDVAEANPIEVTEPEEVVAKTTKK